MGIRDDLQAVLRLQGEYDSAMTDAMRQRGEIIRSSLPALIMQSALAIQSAAGIAQGDLMIEGRDGTGLRSQVPWVRFSSRSRSPKATTGWYVVLLFREDGSGVYLSLAHASTRPVGGEFVSRSKDETERLVAWAHEVIAGSLAAEPRLLTTIRLGKGPLAQAYEATTAVCFFYDSSDLPSDDVIQGDFLTMARMLSRIYAAELQQVRAAETSLDVISAVTALDEAITGVPSPGQGFGLSQAERRAVELRAMSAAIEYFEGLGCDVEDMSVRESYDLKVTSTAGARFVEVKGTTGPLGDIVLTKNEVALHLNIYPANGLFVLHGVRLIPSDSGPQAVGGEFHVQVPWQVQDDRLSPLAYRYRIY